MVINPFVFHSMPIVTDLLETCVDEVLQATVPMATVEEAGPGAAHTSASSVTEETLSLTEAAARLKQLEIENTPVSVPARTNVNLNMNNQVRAAIQKPLAHTENKAFCKWCFSNMFPHLV